MQDPDSSPLDAFLNYANAVAALADAREVPAYAETCTCGGSVTVGQAVSRADLRRIHANFLGRHQRCATAVQPARAALAATQEES